jgi:4-hydroxybenzoyl-CoA thioesterase
MSKPTNPPFTHSIRVAWADCDPANIAYTGRIPYWALESMDAWFERVTGLDWYALNVDRGIGTPFVHMSINFRAPVTPRHPLICEVYMTRLGTTSIAHRVVGRQDGVLCFEGEFVSVFVEAKTLTARKPPEDLVKLLQVL